MDVQIYVQINKYTNSEPCGVLSHHHVCCSCTKAAVTRFHSSGHVVRRAQHAAHTESHSHRQYPTHAPRPSPPSPPPPPRASPVISARTSTPVSLPAEVVGPVLKNEGSGNKSRYMRSGPSSTVRLCALICSGQRRQSRHSARRQCITSRKLLASSFEKKSAAALALEPMAPPAPLCASCRQRSSTPPRASMTAAVFAAITALSTSASA